jgi:ParB family transcriptional regulator, chromosome partitioning protein
MTTSRLALTGHTTEHPSNDRLAGTSEQVRSSREALHLSESVEWYTPPHILEAVRRLLGQIDLDPASCYEANQTVHATRYFSAQHDGLARIWYGRVFLNPPYGKLGNRSWQEIWSQKLVDEFEEGRVVSAVLLVNAATETQWFQALGRRYPICLINGRIKFKEPSARIRERLAKGQKERDNPTHGSALIFFGRHHGTFHAVCNELGIAAGTWHPQYLYGGLS